MKNNTRQLSLTALFVALVFLLGVSLGANEDLLSRMGELGLRGVSIGIACAVGSLMVVRFFSAALLRSSDGENRQ